MERVRYLMESHDLTGDEDMSFADLGIDSVALAELRTELRTMLQVYGAEELADEVDTRLLLRLTVAEFFGLVRQFGDGSGQPLDALSHVLGQISAEYEEYEATLMRADAALTLPALPSARSSGMPSNILLTGVTGFLGTFLLASLLGRTPHTIHALVRATDDEHGVDRILATLRKARLWTPALEAEVRSRVRVLCGDLAEHNMGLGEAEFRRLADDIDAILHNGALVNYVRSFDSLRAANVTGTRDLLRLAMTTHRKAFHLVSSTFIYGWSDNTKPVMWEPEGNLEMDGLDFGYSQTKWVAEQLALAAARQGLDVRIYRPALISPTSAGFGSHEDIFMRLVAFMIEHGVALDARNQVSLLPADVVADHLVALMDVPAAPGTAYNMTADDYYNNPDITRALSDLYGYEFTYHDIPSFRDELNRLATRRDPIFPLVDFLSRSADKIAAMEDKLYDNAQYRHARGLAGVELREPELVDTVRHLHQFLRRECMISDARAEVALRA
jgi:thioester reductase-like protein